MVWQLQTSCTGSYKPQVFPLGHSWGWWADGSNYKEPFVCCPGGCHRYSLILRMSPSKLSLLCLRDPGHLYRRKSKSSVFMTGGKCRVRVAVRLISVRIKNSSALGFLQPESNAELGERVEIFPPLLLVVTAHHLCCFYHFWGVLSLCFPVPAPLCGVLVLPCALTVYLPGV